MKQDTVFLNGEGNAWYLRNKDKISNPIIPRVLAELPLPENPTILEVGCGEGRTIAHLQRKFKATAFGLDVSALAIAAAKSMHDNVTFVHGSAMDAYPLAINDADLILFGFCLYVLDREDLMSLVAVTDRALNEGGYLAIHDFHPAKPQKVPYHHKEGLFSYKMRYADLWLANPAYEWFDETWTADGEALTIIRKGSWNRWQI